MDDLRRALAQIFGDGKGHVPECAHHDSIQINNIMPIEDVDAIFEGLDARGAAKRPERFGALAAVPDYRDGTNYAGLNPARRIRVRHIGLTGHANPNRCWPPSGATRFLGRC